MKKSTIILTVLLIGAIVFFAVQSRIKQSELDPFAKCLSDKGVIMYGAYWCPHCQNQKKLFGDSWEYVNYVECSLPNRAGQTELCKQKGITGYPTWDINGEFISGELTLKVLSEKSGCQLG